ncbi:DUF6396 domain-containing protein [Pseudomonas sp. NPDC007930]|uniref:SEL1-like repeat protein n=1 Tax=Pseudomonas sp. NPDC007930 TaxID=3364417 RepID=UPI0036ED1461
MDKFSESLKFECRSEEFPIASIDSDKLFGYARWLQKGNLLGGDEKISKEVERLYRIAAEHGHSKANINLQNGAFRGDFIFESDEHVRFSDVLIEQGVATGYYFVGKLLYSGAGTLQQDPEMALRFFRRAADFGSAEAQFLLAEKLSPKDVAPAVAESMYLCAARQGHAGAGVSLGIYYRELGKFQKALEAFQLGVAGGSSTSASFLSKGFSGVDDQDSIYYMGQEKDFERSRRYKEIWRLLAGWSYASPVVPEINYVLPLPPSKIPEWDGTLKWIEMRKANVAPERPSEDLIEQLAREKNLDPATGKPMPGSPAFSNANFPVRICWTGTACPTSGYWKVIWPISGQLARPDVIQYFEEGAIFPTQVIRTYHPRYWPMKDKWTSKVSGVEWGLMG